MKEIKVGKNVTLTLDNVMVIEQMMSKTKQNFSRTLNFVLSDWIKIRQMILQEHKGKQENLSVHNELQNIKKAKMVKE